jgi:hypothetical protein
MGNHENIHALTADMAAWKEAEFISSPSLANDRWKICPKHVLVLFMLKTTRPSATSAADSLRAAASASAAARDALNNQNISNASVPW